MTKQNPIDQTNLAIATISASFAKAMNKVDPKFSTIFLEELENRYHEIREMELPHIVIPILTYKKKSDFINMLKEGIWL